MALKRYRLLLLLAVIGLLLRTAGAQAQTLGGFIIPDTDDIDAFTTSGKLDPTISGSCKYYFYDPNFYGQGKPYSSEGKIITFDGLDITFSGDLFRLDTTGFFFASSSTHYGSSLLSGTVSNGIYYFTTEGTTNPTPTTLMQSCVGYVEASVTIDEARPSSSVAEVTTHVTSCDSGGDTRYTFDTPCIARWRGTLFIPDVDPVTPPVDPGVALKLGATTNSIICTLKRKGVALARANIELQRQVGNRGDFTTVTKKKTNAKGLAKFDSTVFAGMEFTPFDTFRCFSSTKKKRAVSREAVYRPSSTEPE